MRQHHFAGERLFVDYAGTTLEVVDGTTDKIRRAKLFVAALSASNLSYAEATLSRGRPIGTAPIAGTSAISVGCRRR